jgi:hypothetical protein
MSRNKVIRAVPILVGVLLCLALMQTACAARYSPYLNADKENPTIWNSPNLNADMGNLATWNLPSLDTATGIPVTQSVKKEGKKTEITKSNSVPLDLMNLLPLQST